MNNQRKAVYSERRRVLEGRELKKQVIGYRELTMEDIVEAYVNQDLQPDQLLGLSVEELKAFLQEQLRNAYDLKEGQLEQAAARLD